MGLSRGQSRPTPRGGVPCAPLYLVFLSIYAYRTSLVAELPNLMGNICGEGRVRILGSATPPISGLRNFGVFLYLCLRP